MAENPFLLETVRDEVGFCALRDEWDAVLGQSRQDGPFLRHGWLSAWWSELGDANTMSVLICRDGAGNMAGALPLYVCAHGRFPAVRTARLMADREVGSTGLGAFALPEYEGPVLEQFAAAMRSGEWDTADLRFVDPEHGLLDRIAAENHALITECGSCPCIELPASWDAYLSTLTKHMRHEVRRSERRVAERGLQAETVTRADDLPAAIDDFLRLHESRMRTKFGSEYTVPTTVARFTRVTAAELMREGRLRLQFMRLDGRRVAGLYFFRYGDTMYAEQSGFDEGLARQDVLRALWATAIRAAIAEGCLALDLLLGEQHYKLNWQPTRTRHLYSARTYAKSLTGTARRGRDWVATRSVRWREVELRAGVEPGAKLLRG